MARSAPRNASRGERRTSRPGTSAPTAGSQAPLTAPRARAPCKRHQPGRACQPQPKSQPLFGRSPQKEHRARLWKYSASRQKHRHRLLSATRGSRPLSPSTVCATANLFVTAFSSAIKLETAWASGAAWVPRSSAGQESDAGGSSWVTDLRHLHDRKLRRDEVVFRELMAGFFFHEKKSTCVSRTSL